MREFTSNFFYKDLEKRKIKGLAGKNDNCEWETSS